MDLGEIVVEIAYIFSLIVPTLISLALVIFIWGVIKYITAGDSEEGRSKARNTIIYGVIGLFAIVAVWGLVEIIKRTFSIDETTIETPQSDFRDSPAGGGGI